MNKCIQSLLEEVDSEEYEVSSAAACDIAMLVEKNSISGQNRGPGYYKELLPPELVEINLDEEELKELVLELRRRVSTSKSSISLVWALGKNTTAFTLEQLLDLLSEKIDTMDEEFAWQILIAIDNFLPIDPESPSDSQLKDLIENYNLEASLQKILHNSNRDQNKRLIKSMLNGL